MIDMEGQNVKLPRNFRPSMLHPAWAAFIDFCEDLGFGEIEKLKIQDGLPMIAESVKKKIHFQKNNHNSPKP